MTTQPLPGTYGVHCRFGQGDDASPRTYTYLVHPQHGEVREGDVCVVEGPDGTLKFVTCVSRVEDLSPALRKASAGGYSLKYIVQKVDRHIYLHVKDGVEPVEADDAT